MILLLVAFTLFRPGFWLDRVSEPFTEVPGNEVVAMAESLPDGASMRVKVVGPDFDDPDVILPRAERSVNVGGKSLAFWVLKPIGVTGVTEGNRSELVSG